MFKSLLLVSLITVPPGLVQVDCNSVAGLVLSIAESRDKKEDRRELQTKVPTDIDKRAARHLSRLIDFVYENGDSDGMDLARGYFILCSRSNGIIPENFEKEV